MQTAINFHQMENVFQLSVYLDNSLFKNVYWNIFD